MMNTADNITQMIDTYTDQIERYESMSTWYAAFCAVCILTVFVFAINLMLRQSKEDEKRRQSYYIFLSAIFLLVPSMVTLYLYTFAMNMRKVALYRGYLSFLERQYNNLTGMDIMLFDNGIINTAFSFDSFLVNGLGPVVMAFFVVLALMVGFMASLYFAWKIDSAKVKSRLKICIAVLAVVCVLFDGLCTYYLSINDSVVASVISYCEQQGAD